MVQAPYENDAGVKFVNGIKQAGDQQQDAA
jgi:hypothetical protein